MIRVYFPYQWQQKQASFGNGLKCCGLSSCLNEMCAFSEGHVCDLYIPSNAGRRERQGKDSEYEIEGRDHPWTMQPLALFSHLLEMGTSNILHSWHLACLPLIQVPNLLAWTQTYHGGEHESIGKEWLPPGNIREASTSPVIYISKLQGKRNQYIRASQHDWPSIWKSWYICYRLQPYPSLYP